MTSQEQKAFRLLQETLTKYNKNSTLTAEKFLDLFKQKKYNDKHLPALKSLFKHIPEIERHLGMFQTNCER